MHLCTAGCGFYGSKIYNDMCSKCFKEAQASQSKAKSDNGQCESTAHSPCTPSHSQPSPAAPSTDTSLAPAAATAASDDVAKNVAPKSPSHASPAISRKHARSPSPVAADRTPLTDSSSTSPASTTEPSHPAKPLQTNKARCFRCRVKVPLAKQTINRCRCQYVFCDSHRYPDRHDCDVDFVKLDRDTLARNNPKLHERPKGGRSFQRIDSL